MFQIAQLCMAAPGHGPGARQSSISFEALDFSLFWPRLRNRIDDVDRKVLRTCCSFTEAFLQLQPFCPSSANATSAALRSEAASMCQSNAQCRTQAAHERAPQNNVAARKTETTWWEDRHKGSRKQAGPRGIWSPKYKPDLCTPTNYLWRNHRLGNKTLNQCQKENVLS